jgi:hypothetical protein
LSYQGLFNQGLSQQGLQIQGFTSQGFSSQGFTTQGFTAQGLTTQGLQAQGFQSQGLQAQGLQSQGLQSQGLWQNGLMSQGIWSNGLWGNGLWSNGFWQNGLWTNGLTSQGFGSQGLASQGLNQQGLNFQGWASQGWAAQGFNSQGIQAQGFQAQGVSVHGVLASGVDPQSVALRGVSQEEATAWMAGAANELLLPDQIVLVQLDQGVLTGLSAAGELLRDQDLVGLTIPFGSNDGRTVWIDLTAVAPHPDVSDLPLYTLQYEGESLCAEGKGGLFVPGVWDETGAQHGRLLSGKRAINSTFSCLAGVIAKCVVWGYRPWTQGAEIHQVCTRMARADYCGDGVPHTENGTTIDLFDTRGIQTPVQNDGLTFEAGWDANGAVCVREPRYVDEGANGEVILPSCWADKPSCETFEQAVELGAKIGNDSAHLTRYQGCVVDK